MTEIKPTATESWLAKIALPRMGLWLYVTIALAVALWFLAPHMLKVTLYKLSLITVAGYLGYWISRGLEKSGWRPHELIEQAKAWRSPSGDVPHGYDPERAWQLEQLAAAAYQRRTIIVGFCMIASAIGS